MSVRVTWFGHASMGIHLDDMHILIDPFFDGNPAADVDPDNLETDYILSCDSNPLQHMGPDPAGP